MFTLTHLSFKNERRKKSQNNYTKFVKVKPIACGLKNLESDSMRSIDYMGAA